MCACVCARVCDVAYTKRHLALCTKAQPGAELSTRRVVLGPEDGSVVVCWVERSVGFVDLVICGRCCRANGGGCEGRRGLVVMALTRSVKDGCIRGGVSH